MSGRWVADEDVPDVWTWLQSWYVAQCDGDWEHQLGIEIGTVDNPGWRVVINLADTDLGDHPPLDSKRIHRSDDDWCVTWIEDQSFQAACGPTNLGEALQVFRAWAVGG